MSRWFGLTFLLSITLLGCKKEVLPGAAGAAPTSIIDPAVSALAATFGPDELRVTLVSQGARPRKPLRYAYTPGTMGTLQVTTDHEMDMGIVQASTGKLLPLMNFVMPSITVDFEMFAGGPDDDKNVVIASKQREVKVEARPGTPSSAVESLTRQLNDVVGLQTRTTLSPTGQTLAQELTPPSTVNPLVAEQMKDTNPASHTLSFPLPREAIGLGAQWTVMSVTKVEGVEVLMTQTATLESLEGEVVTVRFSINQQLVRGDAETMGLEPGTSVEFTQFRGEGAGQHRVDLSQPLLFSSERLEWVNSAYNLTTGGETKRLTSTTRTETKTVGTPR